jgi:hypothetical protein
MRTGTFGSSAICTARKRYPELPFHFRQELVDLLLGYLVLLLGLLIAVVRVASVGRKNIRALRKYLLPNRGVQIFASSETRSGPHNYSVLWVNCFAFFMTTDLS